MNEYTKKLAERLAQRAGPDAQITKIGHVGGGVSGFDGEKSPSENQYHIHSPQGEWIYGDNWTGLLPVRPIPALNGERKVVTDDLIRFVVTFQPEWSTPERTAEVRKWVPGNPEPYFMRPRTVVLYNRWDAPREAVVQAALDWLEADRPSQPGHPEGDCVYTFEDIN